MAKRSTLLILGGLAVLGTVAAVALGSGDGDASSTALAHGLELGPECTSITVVNPETFVTAWVQWCAERAAGLDPTDPADLESALSTFLAEAFPGCEFPPPLDAAFTWHAPMLMPGAGGQQFGTRSWDQLIEGSAAMTGGLGAAGDPFEVAAELLARHPTLGPIPVPTPDDEDDRPRPPIPPIDGLGAGGGDGIIPGNVVQPRGRAHLEELGVALAMEPEGAESPTTSTVVVLYDPDWPPLPGILEAFMEEAEEHPDVLVVLASTHDTHVELGLPEELGTIGLAINSADGAGQYAAGHAYGFDEQAVDLPGLLSYFHHATDNAPQAYGVAWQK